MQPETTRWAVRLNPNEAVAYRICAHAYLSQEDIDKAKADFAKADELIARWVPGGNRART
jgi:Tfp pilus assembly protein PilF